MRMVKKWYEKYPEIEVEEVTAATAWDLDFKRTDNEHKIRQIQKNDTNTCEIPNHNC